MRTRVLVKDRHDEVVLVKDRHDEVVRIETASMTNATVVLNVDRQLRFWLTSQVVVGVVF